MRSGHLHARGDGGALAVSRRETSQGPGTFTKLGAGTGAGTFKTLNVTAALAIVPVDKTSDNAPAHRVYAGQRHEVGVGWSKIAKSSGETYINLKIGAPGAPHNPEFGPNWLRCRLVKLEQAAEDGATYIGLWEPRDR